MTRKVTPELINALLLLMWVYAAATKLFAYENFRFQLLGHPMLMNNAATIAWLLPVVEILIATLLLFQASRRLGYYASVFLLLVFCGYIIYMFNFYPHKPCSCGGVISRLSWKEHLVFNAAFIILSLAGLYFHKPTISSHNTRLVTINRG